MTLEQAKQVMEEARRAFSLKTTNKMFDNLQLGQPAMVTWVETINETEKMLAELRFSVGAREAELKKAVTFNQRTLKSIHSDVRANNPSPNTGSPYTRGKIMFDRRELGHFTGNCSEQSAVAAYLAITIDWHVATSTYVVTIMPPGDHLFCVVGLTGDGWPNVAAMKSDGAGPQPIVIDPWMNFVCYASQYPEKAGDKMEKWLAVGKRIAWWGNDMKTHGWYQPGGDYVARFLDSKLKYQRAL